MPFCFSGPFLGISLFFAIGAFSSHAVAGTWAHRPQVALGFTNNANFESSSQDSDFYFLVRGTSLMTSEPWSASLWAGYKDYFGQSQNDLFQWRLGPSLSVNMFPEIETEWNLTLGGQHYVNSPPAQTEESFDYYFLDTSLSFSKDLSSSLLLSGEPGLQVRRYLHFGDRTDRVFYLDGRVSWQMTDRQTLAPLLGIAVVSSTDSLYSKRYFELGANWTFKFLENLRLSSSFLVRHSVFPSREISQQTAVSVGHGRRALAVSSELETQDYNQLMCALTKIIGKNELAGSVVLNHQSSKSGIEDYSELALMTSYLMPF